MQETSAGWALPTCKGNSMLHEQAGMLLEGRRLRKQRDGVQNLACTCLCHLDLLQPPHTSGQFMSAVAELACHQPASFHDVAFKTVLSSPAHLLS